jgi:hypothetical protein
MYYILESVFGTTPTDPAMSRLRGTGATLGMTKSSTVSDEQRPDRQIQDFRHGTQEVGGDINFELSYASQEDFLQAALGGTWGTQQHAGTDVAVVEDAGGDQLVLSAGTWADTGLNLYPGQSITVAGFTEGANNATFEVLSVSGDTLTVTSTSMTAEAAGDSVTIDTDNSILAVGTTRRSFSILRHFSDQTNTDKPYHWHTGQEVNTLSLSITPDARVTGSFTMLGQDVDPKNDSEHATILGSGSLGTPNSNKVFDAFTGTVTLGGSVNACVTEISLTLENGLETRFRVGSRTSKRPSIGRSNLTGTITLYFEDAAELEKFYDETETSLIFELIDPAGNTYVFVLPALVYSGGQPDSQGTTGSITISLPFQAVYDADAGTNFFIEKIDA